MGLQRKSGFKGFSKGRFRAGAAVGPRAQPGRVAVAHCTWCAPNMPGGETADPFHLKKAFKVEAGRVAVAHCTWCAPNMPRAGKKFNKR